MHNVSGQFTAGATEGERMKRLTERTDIGDSPLDEIAFINLDDAEGLYNLRDIAKHGSDELLYEIANRLAEYEDMEEQGLLVRLPCKARDTVWIKGDKFPAEIEEIRITDDGIYFPYVEYDRGYEETEVWDNDEFTLSDFGKTVFLTREEAEKALEGNNGQKR